MEKNLDKSAKRISEMFDSIAGNYDRMNHDMSLGIDRRWRRKFIQSIAKSLTVESPVVLDLACGTGDLTKAMAERGWQVTGLDISEEMMAVGKTKCGSLRPQPTFVSGSAEQIPFDDASFDVVTIAFGLRNFDHRAQCLAEIRRVLKPGGRLAVLEFAVPRNPLWRKLYLFYFKRSIRFAGRLIGHAGAYGYLVDSVLSFPRYESLCAEFTAAGFRDVHYTTYSGGIAAGYFSTN